MDIMHYLICHTLHDSLIYIACCMLKGIEEIGAGLPVYKIVGTEYLSSGEKVHSCTDHIISIIHTDNIGIGVIHRDEQNGSDPDALGRKIARTLDRKVIPFRKRIASPDQHLAVYVHRLLPAGVNAAILRRYYIRRRKGSSPRSE